MNCSDYGKKVKLSKAEMNLWCAFIHKECGIEFDESKAYLIQSRLKPFLPVYKASSFLDLYRLINSDEKLVSEIVSALSTHETSFFRDRKFFDALGIHIIPQMLESHDKLSIWSAACSTGQEAYSLAMICSELLCLYPNKKIDILGTDVCKKSIETALDGIYSDFELKRGLDNSQIRRFFNPVKEGNRVREEIKKLVSFRTANLFGSRPMNKTFDLILCRNVAIYFSHEKKIELYRRIASHLRRDGVLIIGSTETLSDYPAYFRKKIIADCQIFIKC